MINHKISSVVVSSHLKFYLSILFLFICPAILAQDSTVMIERLIFIGDDRISSRQLVDDLDVPIGSRLSSIAAAELVSDIERKLRASGRFKEDLTVRLVKGSSYLKFNIEFTIYDYN